MLRALTPALAMMDAERQARGVVEAAARLEAPPINPANAAAASIPVAEPKIFVLRFMVFFLSMGNHDQNRDERKNPKEPVRRSRAASFPQTWQSRALPGAVGIPAIIGWHIFRKTRGIFCTQN
jgi:hypothetical protein